MLHLFWISIRIMRITFRLFLPICQIHTLYILFAMVGT